MPDRIEELRTVLAGRYEIERQIGQGGMATVYLAEREVAGATQRVALKLIRPGAHTEEVLKRFAQETRVLASLEHPNIARFYDARAARAPCPCAAAKRPRPSAARSKRGWLRI